MPTTMPPSRAKRPPTGLRSAVEAHGRILLYDGTCGLCNRFVQWVLRHDRTGTLRFATLEGNLGTEARTLFPELSGVDSVILISRDGATVRSAAALEVARYLGGAHTLLLLGYLLPKALRDGLYDWIARTRYRWFGRLDACPLPSPETKSRFLD